MAKGSIGKFRRDETPSLPHSGLGCAPGAGRLPAVLAPRQREAESRLADRFCHRTLSPFELSLKGTTAATSPTSPSHFLASPRSWAPRPDPHPHALVQLGNVSSAGGRALDDIKVRRREASVTTARRSLLRPGPGEVREPGRAGNVGPPAATTGGRAGVAASGWTG